MKSIISLMALVLAFPLLAFPQVNHWYRGNTHTHTTNSDGNELPRRVVRWYLDNGYNFLVITDHDMLTETRYLDSDPNDDFILIPGEELSDRAEGKPMHVCGIGIKNEVKVQHGKTKVETLQNDIDIVRSAGGIAQVNHPNWRYSFNDSVISQLKNAALLEVYNISRDNNNYGGGGKPGVEEIWDKVLSLNVPIYGVISDDTHNYLGEFTADKSNPGRGWIMVRAKELTQDAIMKALEKGDFYGTVGVTLKDISITKDAYTVEIDPYGDAKYTTFFIGKDGKILKEDHELKASYRFKGDERYVRARIVCSSGDFAITQPVFNPGK